MLKLQQKIEKGAKSKQCLTNANTFLIFQCYQRCWDGEEGCRDGSYESSNGWNVMQKTAVVKIKYFDYSPNQWAEFDWFLCT